MCGIVGYAGMKNAAPIIFEGLQRLEYRGYDSAGIAVIGPSGLRVHKKEGRVASMVESAPKRLSGRIGIGHTRWATHGEPSDVNAHPHTDASGCIAVVHNGIVENANELRAGPLRGVGMRSDSDSEVLAHLIAAQDGDFPETVRRALLLVEGAYGIAVVDSRAPDSIVIARNGSPVLLGIGRNELFVASDAAALIRHTDQVVHLDDHEMAVVKADGFTTFTTDNTATTKRATKVRGSKALADKGDHPHFMHKEIHDQPAAVERALSGRLDHRFSTVRLGGLEMSPRDVLELRRIKVIGCGSAFYAGLAGAHMIEGLTRIPSDAETAAEFRYRNPIIEQDTLYVAVSQSGETFDTLAAVREIKRKGGRLIGVVNTPGSTISRECGSGIYLHAGPEVSVTSTKTFTATAVAFALLALHLGRTRDLGPAEGRRLIESLEALPQQIQSILDSETAIGDVAASIKSCRDAFFIGRVRGLPVALEGALKLKEVSYIHAEAYPAAELKHGPLTLVGEETPTIVVLPDDDLWDKNAASIAEIRARRGPVVIVTDGPKRPPAVDPVLTVPATHPALAPILLGIPLQLLAYETAVLLGRDVDQPRNLAKSVTVE